MNVPELLERLPDDPSKIAALFRRKGIKGWRHNPWGCPMARYLRAGSGEDDLAVVSDSPCASERFVRLRGQEVRPLPVAVQAFIYRFDNGKYKSLIQESE